jgi:excisionase family DNA binding protein
MDIPTIMSLTGGNMKIELTLSDLCEFAKEVAAQTVNCIKEEDANRRTIVLDDEVFLGSDEVREQLRISKATLALWIKRGYLTPYKVGGKNRFRKTDILNLLTQGEYKYRKQREAREQQSAS